MESQIGGGLIEEVIQVAEGELQLVEAMAKSQVLVMPILILRTKDANLFRWEELEEKAPEGQWEYFARDQHTLPTQEPPINKKH